MSVLSLRDQDKIWARGILRSPERIARLREQMLAGDPGAYESLDYLTRMFNRGMPAMDGKTMVTSDDGYLKDAEQTLRGRMATGPDGRLSVASKWVLVNAVKEAQQYDDPFRSRAAAMIKKIYDETGAGT